MAGPLSGITVAAPTGPNIKRRYSVTQDIVGFRRCSRQYGEIHVHKYAPAHQTQLYFGTVLHQVLDRCHAHFHGVLDPKTKGTLPGAGVVISDATVDAHLAAVATAAVT